MIWILLSLAVLAAMLGLAYWGAGIILYPRHKSQLDVFPERYGLRYEKIIFKTKDDLTLKGWFMPSTNGEKRTLVMCHGWSDNKGHLLERTYFLNKTAGFNLLYFDHRSHGESEGEITTIGYLELVDFEAALSYLKESRPHLADRLGVFGLSMGGAVGIMAMARHPEIKAAVIESSFIDYQRVVRQWAWNHYRVPYFPMVWLTLLMLRLRVGDARVDDHSPIEHIGKIAPRPLFLIGGGKDLLMPEADVRRLHAAAGEPKQLWIVPEAAHAECHAIGGIEFEERVISFYQKHL